MDVNDQQLVKQCLSGDNRAFEIIVDRYEKIMFNLAYRMVNDLDEAQDITQSAFVKAYEKLSQYDEKYKFFSWLYRIVVNESLQFLNKQRVKTELYHQMADAGPTPLDKLDQTEKHQMLSNAITSLKSDYRIVIVLKHLHEMSYMEISEVLEIPEKTVKSRLFTARQQLRDILVRRGIHFG